MNNDAELDQIAEGSQRVAKAMFALLAKDHPPIMTLSIAIELLAITIATGARDGMTRDTIREVIRALPAMVQGHLSKIEAERKS